MQIDWLTVAAQWINFLILMWLLRRFLYQPILRAMDRRQQAIAANLAAAEQKVEFAERQGRAYREKLDDLETRRQALLAEAGKTAELERQRLLAQAREESQAFRRQWQSEFERETHDRQQQLSRQLGQMITLTARKALLDLTGSALEQALFENFLERLQHLPDADKRLLAESADGSLILAASFDLDEASRRRLIAALHSGFSADLAVRFGPLPKSGLGLVLTGSSYTLEWTLEHYFDGLQVDLNAALNQPNGNPDHVE